MNDRQNLLQSMIEGALCAAADPSVTAVLRAWDYFEPGTSAQPLMPFLSVSVIDDKELGIGFGLYRASVQVSLVVHWAESVRDTLSRIRASVRSVMHALPGLAAGGLRIDGVLETSCTEPEVIEPKGDVVLVQILVHSVWCTAPVTPDAVLDPEIYVVDHDPVTGYTYTATQAADPRRITRWSQPGAVQTVSYGFGAWADRASLAYSAPVQPLSTSIPATP